MLQEGIGPGAAPNTSNQQQMQTTTDYNHPTTQPTDICQTSPIYHNQIASQQMNPQFTQRVQHT
jgi:hypothetical protein